MIHRTNRDFTVTASGTEPFTYQWLYNGAPLSDGIPADRSAGDFRRSIRLSQHQPCHARNAGKYSCIVSNVAGKQPA